MPSPNYLLRLGMSLIAVLLVAPVVHADEVELQLIAADREGKPPVDSLVNFRRAADGGLIATQWISGMTLGDKPLFAVQNRGALAPDAPDVAATTPSGNSKLKDEADDLLGDIKKEAAAGQVNRIRPVDVVDPQYAGQTFSLGRPVGPQRKRTSTGMVEVSKSSLVQPGGKQVAADAKNISILCYPVTITASLAGASTTFVPQLSFAGQDLLADCLFEHSPDLPLGDTGNNTAANVNTLEGWLSATRGGARPFRQLTIYLPASGSKTSAYELNGHKFQLAETGVTLVPDQNSAARTKMRASGKFNLELLLPTPAESSALQIPLVAELGPGWQGPAEQLVIIPSGATALTLTVHSPLGKAHVLRPSLPVPLEEASRWHLVALLSGGRTADEIPTAYVLALPTSDRTTSGKLTLLASAAGANGSIALPTAATLTFNRPYPWHANPSAFEEKLAELSMTLASTQPGAYSGTSEKIPPGGYLASVTFGKTTLPGVPLAIAGSGTQGSATLATYHNRCDYYQGEEAQAALIVRATHDVELSAAKLLLTHESSPTPFNVGSVSLAVQAGESRTLFVTLPTEGLQLGRLTLSLEAAGLISYPFEFRLYSPTPKTTFALYSWMTGSFSGPVRVGDKTNVNLLLDQQPSQFLQPDEIESFTTQHTVPQNFRAMLTRDPLLPAAEKTETYDADTEREMAIAMRLGIRYAPPYGWGLNSQEAAWNPKHSLPEDLARMRRLCSLVAQRFRDFGNYAGLHLNWYPTYGGYWENHPATDGHAARRAEYLAKQVAEFQPKSVASQPKLGAEAKLDVAVSKHQFRVGALPRAYEAWTDRASQFTPGLADHALSSDVDQPGLSPQHPIYSSFLPISWFDQQTYYPSVYFSTLPAATVHAYTDYGFSPFQHLWGLDFWAAGVGDKPKWITTMSNGRDVMLPQALLAVARGADGIDINGDDPQASRALSEFLTAYGPLFRELQPESDVAIITSLRQQILHGKLVGRWMGYTGGTYFDLYTKLWYARRPADVLLEEEITPERLKKYSAVFLVNQQTSLGGDRDAVLREFAAAGGKVFKDAATSADFPGEVFKLEPGDSIGPAWQGDRYVATRDQMFVGVHAAYESTAKELDELLAQLPPPRVTSNSHHTLVGTLAGKEMAVVMAANDTRTPPGIYHPWNFWSATVLASEGTLTFDKPYAVYDLFNGGELLEPVPDGQGRFALPVLFDRVAARPLLLLPSAIQELQVKVFVTPRDPSESKSPAKISVDLEIGLIDQQDQLIADTCPVEITVLFADKIHEQFYRAARPDEPITVTLPFQPERSEIRILVRDLISGRKIEVVPHLLKTTLDSAIISPVLITRSNEVEQFFCAKVEKENHTVTQILLDAPQANDKKLLTLAELLAGKLSSPERKVVVKVVDPLEIADVPQRWQPTALDRKYLAAMEAGERVVHAKPLTTKYYQGEKNRNEPDWLHPESGYGEPAAQYRIGTDVILLGTTASNRFLADLHQTVGMKAGDALLAPGNAIVQVVWDAFTPGRNALCIEATDTTGLAQGIDAVLALRTNANSNLPKHAQAADSEVPEPLDVLRSVTRESLPNYLDEFGASVSPIAFTPDGGVLASANLQAENYFRFGVEGTIEQKWLGKYGLTPSASGETLWTSQWWGAPAYIDKVVRCNAQAEPQWYMDAPRYGRSYQHWRHPGHATLPDRASDDLFVAGHCRLARLSAEGKTLWSYDDTPTANDIQSFRFRRDLMLHDVSADGKLLLVAAFGIQPYSNYVSKFLRPALMLFDAETGKLIWEKPGILVDHSPCAFAKRDSHEILVGDESPEHRQLLLLDEQGKQLWSLPRPNGTSAASLTARGTYVVMRSAAPRNNLFQQIGEPGPLQILTLADGSVRELQTRGQVASWKLLPQSSQVLVSTNTGLRVFAMDGALVWEHKFDGPVNYIVSPDEKTFVVGSPRGSLLWLDWQGKVQREVDLLPYNRVTDLERYVREYTRTPGDVPHIDPAPQARPRIDARGNGVVAFSKNLLAPHAALSETKPHRVEPDQELKWSAEVQPGQTHVLSITERSLAGDETSTGDKLQIAITAPGEKEPLYQAELPLSALWEERTIGFRAPAKASNVQITARLLSAKAAELRSASLFALTYPAVNLLAQRVPAAPGELPSASLDAKESLLTEKTTPPSIRYNIPNDVDLTALARGAPPFQRTVEFTTPFDGKLSGQKTSWLAKPLSGSTHATLELKFDAPVELGSLVVYEDPTDATHYTDTYALFVREAKTGRMRQVGSVVGNRSPFNLYTFPAVEIDAITYLWLKSADGHARVAELEGYPAEEDLLE